MSLKIILDVISITNLVSIFAKIFYKPSIFTGDDALLHFVSQNSHFIEHGYILFWTLHTFLNYICIDSFVTSIVTSWTNGTNYYFGFHDFKHTVCTVVEWGNMLISKRQK